jgi:exopolysaccharide biosynthesis polyprenyl glycosylphosphotransferase
MFTGRRALPGLIRVGDTLIVVVALAIARVLWFDWLSGSPISINFTFFELFTNQAAVLPPGWLLVGFWWFTLRNEDLYNPLKMFNTVRIVAGLMRASVGVLMFAVGWQFFLANRVYSRFLLLSYVGISFALLALWRIGIFKLQHYFPAGQGLAKRRALVIGSGPDGVLLKDRLEKYGAGIYECVGFVDTGEGQTPMAAPVLGVLSDLRALVNKNNVRYLMIASRRIDRDQGFHLAQLASQMGLRVFQVPFTWGIVSAQVVPASVGELELMELGALSYPTAGEFIKRIFDITSVLCGLLVLWPVFLAVALGIKLQDGGPILYASARLGKGGRVFPFLKFRSMVVDAEKVRASLQEKNESDGRLFKMTNDPRITPIGAFIRKYSLDELPQLLNVLRGEMNLVGPRPLPVSDLEGIEDDVQYAYWFEQRSRVQPGITGLWQVEGRSDLGFSAMVELDVHYVKNWSLLLDLQILLKTIPAVLRGRGAS